MNWVNPKSFTSNTYIRVKFFVSNVSNRLLMAPTSQ